MDVIHVVWLMVKFVSVQNVCVYGWKNTCREHHTSTNTKTHEKGKQCFDGKDNE